MKTSESIDMLAGALAKAQGEMTPAAKDSTNPHFKSKYADLASAWEAARGPCSRNGLAVIQGFEPGPDKSLIIWTRLAHSSGQWIESILVFYPIDQKPQTLGSCITYGRRYALMAILGIAPDDDDDGNMASRAPAPRPIPPPPPRPTPPPIPRPLPPSPTPVLDEFYGVALFDVAIDDHKNGFKELMRSRFDYVPQTLWPSLAQTCKGVPATDEHLEKAIMAALEKADSVAQKSNGIIQQYIEKIEATGQSTHQVTGKTPMELLDMQPGPALDTAIKKIQIAIAAVR